MGSLFLVGPSSTESEQDTLSLYHVISFSVVPMSFQNSCIPQMQHGQLLDLDLMLRICTRAVLLRTWPRGVVQYKILYVEQTQELVGKKTRCKL